MLVVTRYRIAPRDETAFRAQAMAALEVLTAREGCTGGALARAVDDARLWMLATTWTAAGAYRRALSAYEVKLVAVPLMYRAIDEPSAFESLTTWTPSGGLVAHEPARAPDADVAGPGNGSGSEPGQWRGGATRVTRNGPSG